MMEEKKYCESCAHFVQHYRWENERAYPVGCGHCTYPRVKHRRPEDGCDKWTEKTRGSPDLSGDPRGL